MVKALFSLVAVLAAFLLTCHACLDEEARSLLLFKKMQESNNSSFTNTSNHFFRTWKERSDCCKSWERVVCNPLTHHVQSLDFHVQSLVFHVGGYYYANPLLAIRDCETLLPLSNLQGLTSLNMDANSFNVSLVLACLGRFPSLSEISLRGTNFSEISLRGTNFREGSPPDSSISSAFQGWPSEALQRLTSLDLNNNGLSGSLPPQLRNMTSLAYLDLSYNNFTSDFHELCGLSNLRNLLLSYLNPNKVPWSAWNFSRLVELSLHDCSLKQHQMKWLKLNKGMEYLDLYNNMLTDISFIGHFPHLRELDLSYNSLSGSIPMSIGNLSSLDTLDLSSNNLSGSIPCSLSNLSRLAYLDISNNQLNGSISCLTLPSSVIGVDFRENQMEGTISEAFLSNLVKLEWLRMTRSGLSVNVSNTWIPNFSCRQLLLGSCKINGPFPKWISVVMGIDNLDLSNTSLYGQIPPWLWELPPQKNIASLNLSYNELQGHVPNLGRFDIVDLSFNKLNGPLSALLTSSNSLEDEADLIERSMYLDFKNNSFEGSLPTSVSVQLLTYLDASDNRLTGTIPSIYSNCSSLEFLNLANNNLNGSLPIQFGSNLHSLQSLTLFNNNLEGELPKSLSGCSQLRVLNIGNNFFQGQFPKWISQLKQLRILEMRSNGLNGNFPEDLNTMPYLHFIDVSSNQLSGPIPKSISALPGMLNEVLDTSSENISIDSVVGGTTLHTFQPFTTTTFQDVKFNAKGLYLSYPRILSALTCIDLSNNHLTGEIPRDLDKLKGLKLLNLSRNHLTGHIPASIGKMKGLEELDLSSNKFSGSIPNEFVGLDSMGFLNLSYNNLSGRIPRGGHMLTFGPQYFEGNPNLIDPLLLLDKKRHREAQSTEESEESGGHDQEFWWAIAVGVSFGVGFATFVSAWVLEGRFRKYMNSSMDSIILWLFRSRY